MHACADVIVPKYSNGRPKAKLFLKESLAKEA